MSFLNIAHRGASGYHPENTLLAMEKALALGANALEFDVRSCASGEAVVIHDATLKRTTNGHGRVSAHALSALRALDAGGGERIPTLEEVLERFAHRAVLFHEIKSQGACAPALKLIAHYARRGIPYTSMPVISSYPRWLLAMKAENPALCIGVTPNSHLPVPRRLCARAKALGFFSINPHYRRVTPELVAQAHAHGLNVFSWTVNNPADIASVRAMGADGIISDFPDRIPA